jgi:ABC-2 type transport system ATP-binding protein
MENLRRRLEDEVELHIEIDAPNEAVTKAIQGINGVISVDADEKQYVIKTSTERDVRPDIVRAIAATGNVVVEMRRHEMSLEEAFVTITEKNISLLAKEGVA